MNPVGKSVALPVAAPYRPAGGRPAVESVVRRCPMRSCMLAFARRATANAKPWTPMADGLPTNAADMREGGIVVHTVQGVGSRGAPPG
jgi:hypothetical protein